MSKANELKLYIYLILKLIDLWIKNYKYETGRLSFLFLQNKPEKAQLTFVLRMKLSGFHKN